MIHTSLYSYHTHSFFFFSSRRRHTSWPRDWSSDVCSSDLARYRAAHLTYTAAPTPETHKQNSLKRYPACAAARVVLEQIGRASCRERVWSSKVDVSSYIKNIEKAARNTSRARGSGRSILWV